MGVTCYAAITNIPPHQGTPPIMVLLTSLLVPWAIATPNNWPVPLMSHTDLCPPAFTYANPTSRRSRPPGQCLLLPRLSSNATSSQKPSLFGCPSWPGLFLLKQIWHSLTLDHLQLVLSARSWAPRRQGHSWILPSYLVLSTRSDTEEGRGRLEEWVTGGQWGLNLFPTACHPRHLPRWCVFTLKYRKPDALSSPRNQPFLPIFPFPSPDHQGSVNWNFWFLWVLSLLSFQLVSTSHQFTAKTPFDYTPPLPQHWGCPVRRHHLLRSLQQLPQRPLLLSLTDPLLLPGIVNMLPPRAGGRCPGDGGYDRIS